jgi:hypothetical protein
MILAASDAIPRIRFSFSGAGCSGWTFSLIDVFQRAASSKLPTGQLL